ncbi:MAG: hypothetical protein ABEJ42_01655 [Halobacteriaceae archaeon]
MAVSNTTAVNTSQRYARVARPAVVALAVLGAWVAVSPFLLPGGEDVLTHVGLGGITTALAAWYALRLFRDPDTKLASLWLVLVLGALLVAGALLTHTPGTAFFWSTAVAGVSLVALAAGCLYWGSRFGADGERPTTIFEG